MKIRENEKYYLHWSKNPCTWNDNLDDLTKKGKVKLVKSRFYTTVIAHYSGNTKDMFVVDCTCDIETGDFHAINTSLLKEIE